MVELESALELGVSPRRSKRIRKNRNPLAISPDQSTAATAASKFKSVIETDEMLLEILLRLPDARTVIQCSTVCKRWSSLVFSRKFIHRYIQHHRRKRASDPSNSPPPYTLLAHSLAVDENKYGCPFYKLFSEESKILHGIDDHRHGEARDYLGFLPWPRMMIKASFDDLLLVSSLPSFPIPEAYCVCNPVTKQWLVLPQTNLRPVYYERCGLVCKERTDDQYKFKVVILSQYSLAKPVFNATVFCSETGQWSLKTLATPSALTLDGYDFDNAFTVNGVPHFKLYTKSGELVGMVAFDPFKSENSTTGQGRCCFVDVPADFGRGWRARKSRLCLGVVRGRLRLSQFVKTTGALEIKVWELSNNNNGHDDDHENDHDHDVCDESWTLVHDVSLKRDVRKRTLVLALDPNDGDAIYVMRNYSVLKYRIGSGEEWCEKVGQIPNVKLSNNAKDNLGWWLYVFTLVHPSWPTPIPTLPSL